jgi:hypothetical protein
MKEDSVWIASQPWARIANRAKNSTSAASVSTVSTSARPTSVLLSSIHASGARTPTEPSAKTATALSAWNAMKGRIYTKENALIVQLSKIV